VGTGDNFFQLAERRSSTGALWMREEHKDLSIPVPRQDTVGGPALHSPLRHIRRRRVLIQRQSPEADTDQQDPENSGRW
jgi:hypothetical protein